MKKRSLHNNAVQILTHLRPENHCNVAFFPGPSHDVLRESWKQRGWGCSSLDKGLQAGVGKALAPEAARYLVTNKPQLFPKLYLPVGWG